MSLSEWKERLIKDTNWLMTPDVFNYLNHGNKRKLMCYRKKVLDAKVPEDMPKDDLNIML